MVFRRKIKSKNGKRDTSDKILMSRGKNMARQDR
jgi:hypothetical protein